jgi:predicted dinucleotide-binding enzyme
VLRVATGRTSVGQDRRGRDERITRDGRIDFGDLTSSELLARRLPNARVVKAFNTMYYRTLRTEGNRSGGDQLVLFVAGDDEEAKAEVSSIIEEIGFEAVDTGLWGTAVANSIRVCPSTTIQ